MKSIDFRSFIAIVVVAVWAILALSTLLTQNYTALGAVTPVMMIVVGFVFGYRREVLVQPDGHKDSKKDLSDW